MSDAGKLGLVILAALLLWPREEHVEVILNYGPDDPGIGRDRADEWYAATRFPKSRFAGEDA